MKFNLTWQMNDALELLAKQLMVEREAKLQATLIGEVLVWFSDELKRMPTKQTMRIFWQLVWAMIYLFYIAVKIHIFYEPTDIITVDLEIEIGEEISPKEVK